jgi:hypothetical protein
VTTTKLAGGTDAKTISERLGHTNVAMTLRIYSHVTPSVHKEAAERLEELYQQSEQRPILESLEKEAPTPSTPPCVSPRIPRHAERGREHMIRETYGWLLVVTAYPG